MTNGDKIRSMSDKELARILDDSKVFFTCNDCKYGSSRGSICDKDCVKVMEEWLGQEAEEND